MKLFVYKGNVIFLLMFNMCFCWVNFGKGKFCFIGVIIGIYVSCGGYVILIYIKSFLIGLVVGFVIGIGWLLMLKLFRVLILIVCR